LIEKRNDCREKAAPGIWRGQRGATRQITGRNPGFPFRRTRPGFQTVRRRGCRSN
jgi:hypothetical protein